jgi:dynein heavy chain
VFALARGLTSRAWAGLCCVCCVCFCFQVDLTRKRLERAGNLTSGLADEGIRWQATADQLQTQTELLVGDVFLSAVCIAYYGAFTGSYRWAAVVNTGWLS